MGEQQPIIVREQKQLNPSDLDDVRGLGLSFRETEKKGIFPLYLGLNEEGWSSYYVGATWLRPGDRPLVVLPKIENIDFLRIFSDALNSDVDPKYLEESYNINFEAPVISCGVLNSVLTPLMVSHFLCVVRKLLKRGLKRNYVIEEANLNGKVRGHVLPLQNLKKNVITGHSDRVMCRYQDYSLNYPENQIIKRALLASESLLLSMKIKNNALLTELRKALVPFEEISPEIAPFAVKSIRRDKLHFEYPTAINLAKQILRRTDFSISDNSSLSQHVPEFSIDMSKIFEFYVLSLLTKKYGAKSVLFQGNAGIMGRCDYLIPSEHLIIDAKYKTDYPNKSSEILRADIREVTGYGRSEKILNLIDVHDGRQPQCLVIYPKEYSNYYAFDGRSLIEQSEKLNGVIDFYTMGVPLPIVE